MKKISILFILIVSIIMTSCYPKDTVKLTNKDITNKEGIKISNKKNIETWKKIVSEENWKILEYINKWKKYNFYNLDCKKMFENNIDIKKCQELSLWEIKYWCIDLEWPWNIKNIEELINVNKFNLLDKLKIEKIKKECTDIRQALHKKDIEENVVWDFNIWKCNDTINVYINKKWYPLSVDKNDYKNYLLEKCEIWYAISYKNDCNIITNEKRKNKCIKIKEKVDRFNDLKNNYDIYWEFDLVDFVE